MRVRTGIKRAIGLFLISACINIIGAHSSNPDTPRTIKKLRFDVASSTSKHIRFRKQRFGLRDMLLPAGSKYDNIYQNHGGGSLRQFALGTIFKYRAGTQSQPSLFWKSIHVVDQIINIATASFVASGVLGSWIASVIICKMQKLATTLSVNNSSDAKDIFNHKWKLTIGSCAVYLLMKCQGIVGAILPKNLVDFLIGASDIGVLLALYAFSSIVDPVFGGLIGCSYVSLELIALLISSGGMLSGLMNFRLTPLDDGEKAITPESTEGNQNSNKFPARDVLANALWSVSLLASMPQYFLSLYLVSSSILTYMTQNNHNEYGRVVSWFQSGLSNSAIGQNMADVELRPWALTLRLMALNAMVMATKGVFAYIVICFTNRLKANL